MSLVPGALTRVITRQGLRVQKNSPTLLFGAGVLGMVGSTVLACRATLKLEAIVTKTSLDLEVARSIKHYQYSETDRRRDVGVIYARAVGNTARIYAPSVLLGAASIAALTKSHSILVERNLAVTAAYAAIDEAFAQYRERVIEKYGEDEDHDLRFPKNEIIELDDNGNETVVKELEDSDSYEHSGYARFFDYESPSWNKEPEYNLVFLRCQQSWCNDMLRSRGHIFLNEVYDALGLKRTKAGSVVGWILNGAGSSNTVDFGIFELKKGDSTVLKEGVNGRDGSILLDFNPDGLIWDKIDLGEREEQTWPR